MTIKLPFLFTLLLSLILAACTQATDDPKTVAENYWQYLQAGNTVEAEKLISLNSRSSFSGHSSRINPDTQLTNSEAKTIVTTSITSVDPDNRLTHTETFQTVLVLQQGQWKVDVNQSQMPPTPSEKEEELQQMSQKLSESMQENIESIDEAMTQGMQMLNEALEEGSKDMNKSLLHLMNELNSSMQKSISRMKERHQQQDEQPGTEQPENKQPSQTAPDPRQGEGKI